MDELSSGRFANQHKRPWTRDYVRVVSWNIERGLQFSAILDFLRTAEADLLLLQEVDLNVRRTQHRDIGFELARSLGVNYVFGKEFQELGAGSADSPAHHGLATLSPWPLSHGRIIRFQHQSNFWKPRWYVPQTELFQRRLGGRIALVTETQIYGQRFVTYNLHLESKGTDILRLQQLRETLEDASQTPVSSLVVVGGDFNLNARCGQVAATLDGAGLKDAVQQPKLPTTAARMPWQRPRSIDWIYISDGVHSQGRIHDAIRASDHYPISATLAFSQPAHEGIPSNP